jgi:actin-like ATPase involved in cell morphogenesis
MAYWLGVDIGTTWTAAAVWRGGRVEVATLGTRLPVVPTVVYVRGDGEVLIGEAADRRALTEPRGVVREFKRRIGDATPLVVDGVPHSADGLMAKVLRWVVDRVSESEGGPPDGVAVSYPANWGGYERELLDQVIRQADLAGGAVTTVTVTEPEAAAIFYASQERVDVGSRILVYDLGGGTFDTAVLRKMADGWVILGVPQGVERLGGVDFDQAVFQHVATSVGEPMAALDPDAPATLAALARLRRECVEAKEALSSDTDVAVPVLLPGVQTSVRLTRSELEEMIRPSLAGSIDALRRAVRSAGLATTDLRVVLLVGGSSRIPLIAQLVGSELGRPVAVDAHPKYSVALGAAILAAQRAGDDLPVTTEIAVIPDDPPPSPRRVVAPALQVAEVARAAEAAPSDDAGRSAAVNIGTALLCAVIGIAGSVAAVRVGSDGWPLPSSNGNDPPTSAIEAESSTATHTPGTTTTTTTTTAPTTTTEPTTTTDPEPLPAFDRPPLWPFASVEAAVAWQRAPHGPDDWHLDAGSTAVRFARDFLGFGNVDRVVDDDPPEGDDVYLEVGHAGRGGTTTVASVHLMRIGAGEDAPWEVVGTGDDLLTLDTPEYGSGVTSPVRVGGRVTAAGETVHVEVRQTSSPGVLGETSATPTGNAWAVDVAFTGATDLALTIVAWTGPDPAHVTRFAITAVHT